MSKTSTTQLQNPPMVFKMPVAKDQFGVLIGTSQSSRDGSRTAPALFTVSRPANPSSKRKESFKTQRQLKEEEEQKAILKLKIRCKLCF